MLFEREIKKDIPLYADFLELMRMGYGTVDYDSETALLVSWKNHPCGLAYYLLAATDLEEGKKLFDRIAAENMIVVTHGRELIEYGRTLDSIESSRNCVQIMYDRPEKLDAGHRLTFRHPSEEEYPLIAETYHVSTEEELRQSFESDDFFGAYRHGKFIGYVGLHTEGSMGMLHTFEEYRGKGYGSEIAAFMINRQISLGRIAFGQVFCDNEASIALQKKNSMSFSKDEICWQWTKGTHK